MFYGKEVMSAVQRNAPEPIPRPAEGPADFTQALEIFRDNYTKYRITGETKYKTQYASAEAWLNNYLESMRTGIDNKATQIQTFVTDYQNANPELVELQRKFKVIREDGPKLEDKYSTVRRINAEIPQTSYTEHYVKAGLIVVVVGLIVALSR